jgi:membrane dipeptidase
MIPEYNEPRRFNLLANDLSRRGWTAGRIEKILGRNFARLFTEVWNA